MKLLSESLKEVMAAEKNCGIRVLGTWLTSYGPPDKSRLENGTFDEEEVMKYVAGMVKHMDGFLKGIASTKGLQISYEEALLGGETYLQFALEKQRQRLTKILNELDQPRPPQQRLKKVEHDINTSKTNLDTIYKTPRKGQKSINQFMKETISFFENILDRPKGVQNIVVLPLPDIIVKEINRLNDTLKKLEAEKILLLERIQIHDQAEKLLTTTEAKLDRYRREKAIEKQGTTSDAKLPTPAKHIKIPKGPRREKFSTQAEPKAMNGANGDEGTDDEEKKPPVNTTALQYRSKHYRKRQKKRTKPQAS